MRPFERRAANAFPYYKLAFWDAIRFAWNDDSLAHPTEQIARAAAKKPGKYRISEVTDSGRRDLEPFEIK